MQHTEVTVWHKIEEIVPLISKNLGHPVKWKVKQKILCPCLRNIPWKHTCEMRGKGLLASQLSLSFFDPFISEETARITYLLKVWLELITVVEAVKTKLRITVCNWKQVCYHPDICFNKTAVPSHFAWKTRNKISGVAILSVQVT